MDPRLRRAEISKNYFGLLEQYYSKEAELAALRAKIRSFESTYGWLEDAGKVIFENQLPILIPKRDLKEKEEKYPKKIAFIGPSPRPVSPKVQEEEEEEKYPVPRPRKRKFGPERPPAPAPKRPRMSRRSKRFMHKHHSLVHWGMSLHRPRLSRRTMEAIAHAANW